MRTKGKKIKDIYNSRIFERFTAGYNLICEDKSRLKHDFDYACLLRETAPGTVSWETLGYILASLKK